MDMNIIGQTCRVHRIVYGYTQKDVAKATGYTVENISKFENGNNDNSIIFYWYLEHGLKISDIQFQEKMVNSHNG